MRTYDRDYLRVLHFYASSIAGNDIQPVIARSQMLTLLRKEEEMVDELELEWEDWHRRTIGTTTDKLDRRIRKKLSIMLRAAKIYWGKSSTEIPEHPDKEIRDVIVEYSHNRLSPREFRKTPLGKRILEMESFSELRKIIASYSKKLL